MVDLSKVVFAQTPLKFQLGAKLLRNLPERFQKMMLQME
jgi:hypothetical protein